MKLRALIKRVRNVWKRHRWRMFGPLLWHNVRYYGQRWVRHGSFGMPRSSVDQIPGLETHRAVYLSELGFTGAVGDSAEPYQPIDEAQFRSVMKALPIRLDEYVFVDLGSGKGRAVLLAAQAGFKRVTGVEFSDELHRVAQCNLAAAEGNWPNVDRIHLVHGDAAQFAPPVAPVVCFLYNPFGASVMSRVIDAWCQAMAMHSEDVWVVYTNPTQSALFMNEPAFKYQFTEAGSAVFRRA